MVDAFKDIEKLEADLWEAADNLHANSEAVKKMPFSRHPGGNRGPVSY